MSLGRYMLGASELVLICVTVGLGSARLRARFLPGWSGAPARLAELTIGVSGLVLVMELLGALRLFDAAALTAVSAAAGLSAWRLAGPAREAEPEPAPRQMGRAATGVAIAVAFLVAAHWGTFVQQSFYHGL